MVLVKIRSKPLYQSAVMRSILRQIKVFEDFGGGPKDHVPGLLSNSKCGHPDGDEPVLTERQSVLGVSGHLQPETAVSAGVPRSAGGGATDW